LFAEVLPKIYVGPELSEGLIIVLPLSASTIFAIIDKVSKPIKEKITDVCDLFLELRISFDAIPTSESIMSSEKVAIV
ncbi:hypothetical protein WAJ21_22290, partial [Acinetobacter baumannii]